ncbi:MAG: NUDIX hydrolase [Anaerolineales bacterium]|nr:NUDIX hydrolase [Anaerolineales bacterium]
METQPPRPLSARAAEIKYCAHCGHAVEYQPRYGALRPVCPACHKTHFVDPKVAVAVLVERGARVLLIQRGGAPERGKWSFPAGFVDAGEDPARAAEREALEETGLRVRVTALLDVLPRMEALEGADILIVYRAEVVGGALAPGDDAAAAGYFGPAELPPDLAFASTRRVLARWLAER